MAKTELYQVHRKSCIRTSFALEIIIALVYGILLHFGVFH